MDLFSLIGTCLRRWYVTLPVLALAAYGAMLSYQAVPAVYSSEVSIAVLPSLVPSVEPEEGEELVADNPYAGSGGPRFAAAVLARNINTADYLERVGLADDDAATVEASAAREQPVIEIVATGSTPEGVLAALEAVQAEAAVVLTEFQTEAGAPVERQYRIATAVPPDKVTEVTPSRLRTAGVLVVLGVAAAAGAAVLVDVLVTRRRSAFGRRAKSGGDDTNGAGDAKGDERDDDELAASFWGDDAAPSTVTPPAEPGTLRNRGSGPTVPSPVPNPGGRGHDEAAVRPAGRP